MLLSTKHLRLRSSRKLQPRYIGPFRIASRIGSTAYKLDLTGQQGLRGIHDVFHVSLLRPFRSNGVDVNVLPVEVDGDTEFEVDAIKNHRLHNGELQFLTSFTGFDESEDMWLSRAQLEHAGVLLGDLHARAMGLS